MRSPVFALVLSILLLDSCGYVGPVVPPSPSIPATIRDLAAVERGSKLVITCTTPLRTTDSLLIKHFSDIDLAIGPDVLPDFNRWSASAKHYELPLPPEPDRDDPRPVPIVNPIPVEDLKGYEGKQLAIAVRASAKHDRYSAWSNVVHLELVEPLQPPAPLAEATAEGVRVTWNEQRPGLHYAVFRKGPADNSPLQVGTAESGTFIDVKSQFQTPYTYSVVAQDGPSAESLPGLAQPNPMVAVDKFPPTTPQSLTVLPAANSIEVSWERSPEQDLKGYLVFRSINNGPYEQVGDLLTVPSFSDRSVEHGKSYRYAVSAIDQVGNESQRSQPSGEVAY